MSQPQGEPPQIESLDVLCARLRALRGRAGSPSYAEIARRVGEVRAARGRCGRPARRPSRITVYDCFRDGRARLDIELVVDIAEVLDAPEPASWWRAAYGAASSRVAQGSIVSVLDRLPAAQPEFVGRRAELAGIHDALATGADRPRVAVLGGMAGVGKTQLALTAADALPGEGVRLFVNLRGFDEGRPPAEPKAVLDSFLRVLGVPAERFAHLELAARAELYRQTLATSAATVVVLDDAADEQQVQALLPGTGTTAVIVTSRHSVAGPPGALLLDVEPFSPGEATGYLRRVVGGTRIDAEVGATDDLIDLCGALPLALAVAAAQLLRKPDWSIADHVARLVALPRDDAVGAALAASYRCLCPEDQRLFRLLALHPGRDGVEAGAAAALAAVSTEAAAAGLHRLVAEHLLQVDRGHHRFHDLVRTYADRLVRLEDPQREHRAALERLLAYSVHSAANAMDRLGPHGRARRPDLSGDPAAGRDFADAREAAAWLAAERATLVGTGLYAAANGWPEPAYHLSAILHRHLHLGGHYQDAETLHRSVLPHLSDPQARALTLSRLGGVCWLQERFDEALEHLDAGLVLARTFAFDDIECGLLATRGALLDSLGRYAEAEQVQQRSLELARRLGDRVREGIALGNLGCLYLRTGPWTTALRHFEQDLAIAREVGDSHQEARVLGNIGDVHERLGRYDEALRHLHEGRDRARAAGIPQAEVNAVSNLASVYRRLGRVEVALEHGRTALGLVRRLGDHHLEGHVLDELGHAARQDGDPAAGLAWHEQALALALDTADRPLEAVVRNSLAEALAARLAEGADPAHRAAVADQHERAFAVALELGERPEQARAHDGLARLALHGGDVVEAVRRWQLAAAVYEELDAPQATAIRARLARLGGDVRR